jgi:hypothetical protein
VLGASIYFLFAVADDVVLLIAPTGSINLGSHRGKNLSLLYCFTFALQGKNLTQLQSSSEEITGLVRPLIYPIRGGRGRIGLVGLPHASCTTRRMTLTASNCFFSAVASNCFFYFCQQLHGNGRVGRPSCSTCEATWFYFPFFVFFSSRFLYFLLSFLIN